MHKILISLAIALDTRCRDIDTRRRASGQRGQATAEYALVILGAAAMALLVIGWASNTSSVGELFDRVVKAVAGRIA